LESERFTESSISSMPMQMAVYLKEIMDLRTKLCKMKRMYDIQRLKCSKTKDHPPNNQSTERKKVRVVKGEDDPCSNFFKFTFVFKGVIFDSAEKAFQYFKALKGNCIGLCQKIQMAPNALAAKRLGRQIPGDTEDMAFEYDLMYEILAEKLKQCRSFRDALRDSIGSALLHSTYEGVDTWWTTGLNYWDADAHHRWLQRPSVGMNVFGDMLTHVREQLLPESAYETQVDVEERKDCAYILHDGERPPEPEPRRRAPMRPYGYYPRQDTRVCHYCSGARHIARYCRTKQQDESKTHGLEIEEIRDPIIRSRIVRWRQFQGLSRPSRTFNSNRYGQPPTAPPEPARVRHAESSTRGLSIDDLMEMEGTDDTASASPDSTRTVIQATSSRGMVIESSTSSV
jgi:ribA/ribD-fused uncharacterized protein